MTLISVTIEVSMSLPTALAKLAGRRSALRGLLGFVMAAPAIRNENQRLIHAPIQPGQAYGDEGIRAYAREIPSEDQGYALKQKPSREEVARRRHISKVQTHYRNEINAYAVRRKRMREASNSMDFDLQVLVSVSPYWKVLKQKERLDKARSARQKFEDYMDRLVKSPVMFLDDIFNKGLSWVFSEAEKLPAIAVVEEYDYYGNEKCTAQSADSDYYDG